MQNLDLASEDETRALGARLATLLQRGDVVALHGDLGAGKTTLVRGLIQSILGPATEVPSPTYALVQMYEGPSFPLWHFDLYRIEQAGDLQELGWDDTPGGVALIEWPQRAGAHLPENRLDVFLQNSGEGRRARLEARGEGWQERLDELFV
ncbi:MAG: tRNA (adenosine(37)-N6)-threonylcarbamoyltransferase complex ATPase subunit type 1 TsaE [Hyphomonas sp.]|uniref:tRNA (adenosine(37)-N6)-threonylcarbamoyltransferase complex ATPase subunit type 1 TsaE n=1 Tax=Hyphomonas sp. TaxID=87 RepID=UPI001803CD71|nr:tRNA (adenosine(37)-N6)-threonylcarbamoyltransferase complex ATPase subunit type 1 TsaE [Hyphomonas sp.]MBA3069773.1 tRNA (adenosine(37)-N6)-threonylcarbamoyltransferase complex ATPase subunit type 1 TsaE [Hyphomonas sp.]MBU4062614.1 tRNA (adenosine(37)-N6)-threonylcarbamoyltransferase complex ATPase subunit type 1 TsaE [Alphaproteobacteria bacterium]MBU4163965.1 tRNA (adenosine(37)-N6)-threonylcarbamoyltransferase complex ATPase subunit type 1 TsaE [Alphaproteobacteria bacterium]